MIKYLKTFFIGILGICGVIIAMSPIYLIYKKIFGEAFGAAFPGVFPFMVVGTCIICLGCYWIGCGIQDFIKNDKFT